MAVTDRIEPLCRPILDELGVELFDLEHEGGVVRVTVEREGGVDMQLIAELTRRISRALDEHDPLPGKYTLEVSSPGLERTLRTPEHHRWATGKQVRIKTKPGTEGPRRLEGTITAADDRAVTVEVTDADGAEASGARQVPYDDIERTRTVFEWGPAPKPGGKQPKGKKAQAKAPGARSKAGKSEVQRSKAKRAEARKGKARAVEAGRSPGSDRRAGQTGAPGADQGHDEEAKVES